MKKLYSDDIVKRAGRLATWEETAGSRSELLEVNVIYTEPEATAAALKAAESFAQRLGVRIHLRAAIPVPVRLPLDQSPVSVRFMKQLLLNLANQVESDGHELTVHLYLCRDRLNTLLKALKPNSLVVIAGRKHWWPTTISRMVRAFQSKGNQVAFIDVKRTAIGRPR